MVNQSARELHPRKVEAQRTAGREEEERGDEAPAASDGERGPVDGLDQYPAEAPAQSGGDE